MTRTPFTRVEYSVPHHRRARQILAAHPEVRALMGTEPMSALWVFLIVTLQLAVGVALRDQAWWLILVVAYIVGATANHALFILIHECAHNLAFRRPAANRLLAVVANIPLGPPVAIPYCRFHLIHHSHQGEVTHDPDVPFAREAELVGRSRVAKAIWLGMFPLILGVIRPLRFSTIPLLDRWTVFNVLFQAGATAALVAAAGWWPLGYLCSSTFFALGPHPLGIRSIQEHYAFTEGQETYSYYGPMNKVAFNSGFHNEHHDLPSVPWSRLPRLRAMAPEFYESLHAYRSWLALLWRFVMDRGIGPDRRIVRPDRAI